MDAGKRAGVLAEALTWVGTPFKHMGRDRGGVDCGGLLWLLHKDRVRDWPPFPGKYPEDWALHTDHIDVIHNFIKPLFNRVHFARPGDIVLFQFGRAYSHGAVVGHGDTFIHAWGRDARTGMVIESRDGFFNLHGKPRPRLAFSLRDELWL